MPKGHYHQTRQSICKQRGFSKKEKVKKETWEEVKRQILLIKDNPPPIEERKQFYDPENPEIIEKRRERAEKKKKKLLEERTKGFLEETKKNFVNRYLDYLCEQRDYFFYQSNLGIRGYNSKKLNHKKIIQDKGQLFFEFDRHYDKKAVETIKKAVRLSKLNIED